MFSGFHHPGGDRAGYHRGKPVNTRLQCKAEGGNPGNREQKIGVGIGVYQYRLTGKIFTAYAAAAPGGADSHASVGQLHHIRGAKPIFPLCADGKAAIGHIDFPVGGDHIVPPMAGKIRGYGDFHRNAGHGLEPAPGLLGTDSIVQESPLHPVAVFSGFAHCQAAVKGSLFQGISPGHGIAESAGIDQLFVFRCHLTQLAHAAVTGGEHLHLGFVPAQNHPGGGKIGFFFQLRNHLRAGPEGVILRQGQT